MSKSLARVRDALEAAGLGARVVEMPEGTRTAEEAARAIGCEVDRIAKSVILRGEQSGEALLFVTAGGRRVDLGAAAEALGEPLARADAAFVRERTGFAIGGVVPIAHRHPPRSFWDETLDMFARVWAAAGTPRHVFEITPADLRALAGAAPLAGIFAGM